MGGSNLIWAFRESSVVGPYGLAWYGSGLTGLYGRIVQRRLHHCAVIPPAPAPARIALQCPAVVRNSIALDHMHFIGMRRTEPVGLRFVVQPVGVDDKRIAAIVAD